MNKKNEIWLRYMAEHYGMQMCLYQLEKEMDTLSKSLCASGIIMNPDGDVPDHILENLADVYISLSETMQLMDRQKMDDIVRDGINRRIWKINNGHRAREGKSIVAHILSVAE